MAIDHQSYLGEYKIKIAARVFKRSIISQQKKTTIRGEEQVIELFRNLEYHYSFIILTE